MPAWILMALRLLGAGAAGGAGAEAAFRAIPGGIGSVTAPLSQLVPGGIQDLGRATARKGFVDHHGIFHDRPHRRRRRRALTASDRADIAFIAGLLGVSAGSKFAAVIGAR